jgi:hypothetical protein
MATYTKLPKATADFIVHIYGSLLCEDGYYLLQEDSSRINLEWYNTKDAKSITVWTT